MNTTTRAMYGLVAAVPLLLSLLAYFGYIYLLGFPDGFISEQQRAQRLLAYAFIAVSVCASGVLFYLVAEADERRGYRHFLTATILYLAFVVATVLVDHFYCARLMSSTGG